MNTEKFMRTIIQCAWPLKDMIGIDEDLLLQQFIRNCGRHDLAVQQDNGMLWIYHPDRVFHVEMHTGPKGLAKEAFDIASRLIPAFEISGTL